MPTILTAKQVAENALKTIGAFPNTQTQADAGDLRTTLMWLEMILNTFSGYRPVASMWRTIDIPVEEGIGDYLLSDYDDDAGTQHVFSVSMVDQMGNVDPLEIVYESKALEENLVNVSTPSRAMATRTVDPVLRVFPAPAAQHVQAGKVFRVRIQTFHTKIESQGNGDTELLLRPSWYLWLTKKLSYEIGGGPVRRLPDYELKRFEMDADKLENLLLSRDGKGSSPSPPVTEPMAGS